MLAMARPGVGLGDLPRRRPAGDRARRVLGVVWATVTTARKPVGDDLVYEARNIAAVRIARHRLGKHDSVAGTYDELGKVLSRVRRATEEAERRG